MKSSITLLTIILILTVSCQNKKPDPNINSNRIIEADVCIYGATASGILAALAVKREGKSVVIIEPSRWVGGILGAGIKPEQDCPNINAVGGMSRGLVDTLGFRKGVSNRTEISPKDIREDFLSLLKKYEVNVIYDHRVNLCLLNNGIIEKALFDFAPFTSEGLPIEKAEESNNLVVKSKMYIDASYEGDLLFKAGVSFRIGRESTLDHGETLAGVRPLDHFTPIDPYVIPGDPSSGLLKWVETDHGKPLGSGDHYTQAYNFRFYLTSDTTNQTLITPPEDYKSEDYELIGRYIEYLKKTIPSSNELILKLKQIFPGWKNDGEYNYQRKSLITMAPVGISHRYANGDYATKSRIWKMHKDYLKGLYHFMSTDSRIPQDYKNYVKGLGLDINHHPETNGWPHQLYIRVSRRLLGSYTITEHDVYNKMEVEDPIGLAQYGIDTYPSRRIVAERNDSVFVALGGKMFIGGAQGPTNIPYPISYRAITPLSHECTNLLVPVCFSATHLGYASARMEPVFMINGESAGIAAAQAIDEKVSVQNIDQSKYQKRLISAGQILAYDSIEVAN